MTVARTWKNSSSRLPNNRHDEPPDDSHHFRAFLTLKRRLRRPIPTLASSTLSTSCSYTAITRLTLRISSRPFFRISPTSKGVEPVNSS